MSEDNDDYVSPTVNIYDTSPPEIKLFFENLLKYRVDPRGEYYGITYQQLVDQLAAIPVNNIVAIGNGKDATYQKKGHMYDPILQSFVQGAGGQISMWDKEELSQTPVVLRGITKRKEMEACRQTGRDFYYIDTGYFGNDKKKNYHRITKNNVQNFGPIVGRPVDRLRALGIRPTKFKGGSKILLAPPSQKLLNLYDINLEEWMAKTIAEIKSYTDREIVVRLKQSRTVRTSTDTMEMALSQDIHCLVTFSSIAATEAILFGKPAFTLGPNAAAPMCLQDLKFIETPKYPSLDEVDAWAAHLSYCQFTEAEMRDGTAWRLLNE